jgi:hypothetical protein
MELKLLLAVLAIVTILGLAFYAGILISKIKMHNEQNKQRQMQLQAEQQQRNAKIGESIRIIARATVQKQCNLSEAAIRLTILFETLLVDKAIEMESEYPALSELFEKVKEMPTHEQRKTVASKELKKLDKQRLVFEAELEERIIKEASQLVNFSV